jgi:hypothetical protein
MSPDDQPKFYGVPHQTVLGIGQAVVAAANVEAAARNILQDLGQLPGKHQAANVLDRIRKVGRVGLPEPVAAHARTTSEELKAWSDTAAGLLDDRNRLVHSQRLYRGETLVDLHLRSGLIEESDHAAIEQLVGQLEETGREAMRLHHGLLRTPSPGVYVRNTSQAGQPWVIIHSGDDPNFPRPSEEEIDRWWRELGPLWIIAQPEEPVAGS